MPNSVTPAMAAWREAAARRSEAAEAYKAITEAITALLLDGNPTALEVGLAAMDAAKSRYERAVALDRWAEQDYMAER